MEHQNEYNTRHSSSSAGMYVCMYVCIQARLISTNPGSMEEEFEYGLTWDVFHCAPSRGGRDRRAAVDIFRGVFV